MNAPEIKKHLSANLISDPLQDFHNIPDKYRSHLQHALTFFQENQLPGGEFWKGTQIHELLNQPLLFSKTLRIDPANIDLSSIFRCELHHLQTQFISTYNGIAVNSGQRLKILPDGVIFGSLHEALRSYPQLFDKYVQSLQSATYNTLTALNIASLPDGLFLYVPDNIHCHMPFQLVNLIDHHSNLFVQTTNIIILGKNSHLTLLHCDDSLQDHSTVMNSVSEFFICEQASLHIYKLQNKNLQTALLNTNIFHLSGNSQLHLLNVTFNAGIIRNEMIVNLNEPGAHANVMGLYLIDKTQQIDNVIFINHNAPECESNQTFKGILDDSARAMFTGKIFVKRHASKTNAYQSSRHLLLTNEASAFSRPFLEIYNDDVRCTHGSTTGHLDPEALFYLRQRGICEKNARLLLMYAFADEIIRHIQLPDLKHRTENMVHRRLRGELNPCELCLLHCSPDHIQPYEITL